MNNDKKIFVIFGARRSRSNYFEHLVLFNFKNSVANLNKVVAPRMLEPLRRPWFFEVLGSKHVYRAFNKQEKSQYIPLLIMRHPLSWLEARIRYSMMQQPSASRKKPCTDVIHRWIEVEYNDFYLKHLEAGIPLYLYETVLLEPERVVLNLAERFNLNANPKFHDVTRIIMPGGGMAEKRANGFNLEKFAQTKNPSEELLYYLNRFDSRLRKIFDKLRL